MEIQEAQRHLVQEEMVEEDKEDHQEMEVMEQPTQEEVVEVVDQEVLTLVLEDQV